MPQHSRVADDHEERLRTRHRNIEAARRPKEAHQAVLPLPWASSRLQCTLTHAWSYIVCSMFMFITQVHDGCKIQRSTNGQTLLTCVACRTMRVNNMRRKRCVQSTLLVRTVEMKMTRCSCP
jgi:hypothetical protein